ncbi:anhydro-N-acetylmuramic acid kinase [Streptomyces sp. NPDC059166]|uniref:anhydro-N-acetylmuramic acid kinase n=1 Tax=Streptomyces sp. NPDC059166 TaxID=3346752 RepID=UPI0036994539
MRVIGLMSGTSYDGIDAAAADIERDGDTLVVRPLGMVTDSYTEELRTALAAAMPPAPTTLRDVCVLDTGIGRAFAEAAARADTELCGGRAELAVSHGQTVYHWVEKGQVHGTLQIGQPAWIAERTGLPVLADLRTRDVAAGGQGAPLVSMVDALWLAGRGGTPVALNIGGIANVTAVRDGAHLAFDTGPGNALLDAAVSHGTGGRLTYDAGGELAARGRVRPELLRTLLGEPYYGLPAPKTTGKELFHLPYLLDRLSGHGQIPLEDVAATLTRLTAVTVADAVRDLGASEVIASGGGILNPELMRALREELSVPVRTSDEAGLASASKEALAFAVLGWLGVHGLPGTLPSCTGARRPAVLGSLTPGLRGFPVLAQGGEAPRSLRVEGG